MEKQLGAALARIQRLEGQVATARKDSSTSSKPPSSDIVKPPRPKTITRRGRPGKRRPVGEPGHARHERTPFPQQQVDKVWTYEWVESSLAEEWKPLNKFQMFQQCEENQ